MKLDDDEHFSLFEGQALGKLRAELVHGVEAADVLQTSRPRRHRPGC